MDPETPPTAASSRFSFAGRSLREHAARGMVINTAFLVGLSGLGFVRVFVLAAILTREDYGIWGILSVSIGTVLWLKQVGIGDKFVQQEEADQEAAFQKAFTLELISTGIFMALLLALMPPLAELYGEPEILLPGIVVIALTLPSIALRAPLWIFYRQMDFLRQRALQSIEPIVALIASLAMALAGWGYWALLLGAMAGAWASAAAVIAFSPYRLRLRFDVSSVRSYWSFSWPLFVAGAGSLVIAQVATLTTEAELGLAAVGTLALASQITVLTQRVDEIVTGVLYPAVCAVRDRRDLLYESFVKSNRLALMWGMPFGIGVTLFAEDLVRYLIGTQWEPGIVLLQLCGVTAALGQVGFNWSAYFRARDETRPMAVASVVAAVVFVVTGVPLLFAYGLDGVGMGIAAQAAAHLAVRAYYLRRLFEGFGFLRHALRAVLPSLPASGAVLLARLAEPAGAGAAWAAAELVLYVLVTAAATWWLERGLLREALGYLFVRGPREGLAS